MSARFTLELEQEADGRWIAEVVDVPGVKGVMAYGATPGRASRAAVRLAERVLAERFEEKEERGEKR